MSDLSTMPCLICFLWLYTGLFYNVTNALSFPLTQDMQEAIDDYIFKKQHFLLKDVEILASRLEEVESMRANDVDILTNRLTEVENMRTQDVRILTSRLAEEKKMRAKDVEVLTKRVTEVKNIHTNDLNFFTNRLLEMETVHKKQLDMLANRFVEVENMCNKDLDILTSRKPGDESMRSNEEHVKICNSSEVEGLHGKTNVNGLTNRLTNKFKNNNAKEVKTLKTHSEAFQDLNIVKRTSASVKMRPRVAPITDWVAFHGILHVSINNPAWGHIIPFSDMKTNIGTGYDVNTGVFTCNTPGLYVFSWSIRIVEPKHGLETELVLNGATVGYNTSGGGDNSGWGYGSATVTLNLQKGDEVWVRSAAGSAGVSVNNKSMFTGFLLHA